MKIKAVTDHALTRFMERTKCKRTQHSLEKLWQIAEQAVPIGRHRYYCRGWVVVIVRGNVKTAYRPRTKDQITSIYNAINKPKL